MFDFYFSVLSIYIFVVGGFVLKKIFGKNLDTKSVTLLTVYFFQPLLVFWGLLRTPLKFEMMNSAILWFVGTCFVAMVFLGVGKLFIRDKKLRSIFVFTTTNGNTGNLGVPLGILIFGPVSVIYTTMINFANVIWNFTFGVYSYSRGNFSVIESIKNIFKMPILWAGVLGIIFNLNRIPVAPKIDEILEIGAHASIAIQLFLLGLFAASVKIKKVCWGFNFWTIFVKFILMPGIGILVIFFAQNIFQFELSKLAWNILILQFTVPLAVNNVNLASLYDCRPKLVAELVLTTTVLFLVFVPLLFWIFSF